MTYYNLLWQFSDK